MAGNGTIRLGSTALDAGRTPPPIEPRPGTLQPGALLDGRYRILSMLGTGGMGSVYRAEHEAIGRVVAVKVLHPEHCASHAERERFRREARVAVRLRSPHVVETLDFGEDPEGRLFLVMELLEGEPVRSVLAREGQLAPERVVRLLRQLLAGLEAAHAAGIVHRDLKPENLWLDGSGASERLRLLDFGIAKWTGPASGTAQTQAGLVVGTPEYLAPEQAVGGEVDHRADIYSTGVLAFVLLTGRHPFDTRDVRALLAAHAYRAVPSPSTLLPELAAYPRLLEMVARATEKDRERRPGSARELIQVLEGAEFPVRLARSWNTQSRLAPTPAAAARASLLGIPAATMPDVVNLTLVRVHVARWDSWSPAASPAFRARHLAAHDEQVLPIVRAFGGLRIDAQDGGSLFAFRSPTDAVHCAAALQDSVAADVRPWAEVGRLELQIGVHQGEVHLDRKGASGAPLATARSLAEGAAVVEVWLTRGVYLTMSRSEAPAEEMGPRALAGLMEPVPTYRLVRGAGPEPYGGRHAGARPGRSPGALTALIAAVASIQVAGETEGRPSAMLRVLWSGAALMTLAALEGTLGGLHALVYRAHRVLRPWQPRPRPLDQLLTVLERARRIAAVHEPELALALRRPVRRG